MPSRNRPNSHICNGLTRNSGHPVDTPPGSAPEANAPGPPRAWIPALLLLFAPTTPAAVGTGSDGPVRPDVQLVAPFGHLSHDAGVVAVQTAAAGPVARLRTWASIRSGTGAAVSGPDVEPDVLPTAAAGAYVGRRFEVLAEADRTRTFTPSLGDLVAGG